MKIVLHGLLAERFGREYTILTDVPAEAIEGLSRQLLDWPRDLLIDAIGFDTEALLNAPTDRQELHLMPAMRGGGGKWGQIILGAALIGVAFIPGFQGVALLGLNITRGMIFMMGAGMMMAGISQVFMKAPTVDKSADPPASKYLGINKNTTAAGTLIAGAWGRIKLSGQWLSLQSDATGIVTTSFPVSPT